MSLIGLCGRKRVGKDTFADHIISLKYPSNKYAFASPLKDACKILFCLTEEQVDGMLKETVDERWDLSPRKIFQLFGTEIMRDYFPKLIPDTETTLLDESFWIYRFKLWYSKWRVNNPDKCLMISDVRFQDEVDAIKELGGTVIRIHRNLSYKKDCHASEMGIDSMKNIDYELENYSTLENYKIKIESFYDDLNLDGQTRPK